MVPAAEIVATNVGTVRGLTNLIHTVPRNVSTHFPLHEDEVGSYITLQMRVAGGV